MICHHADNPDMTCDTIHQPVNYYSHYSTGAVCTPNNLSPFSPSVAYALIYILYRGMQSYYTNYIVSIVLGTVSNSPTLYQGFIGLCSCGQYVICGTAKHA